MKFSQKNNKKSAKLGTNKNKKIRVFATSSLALLIGLGGVLGFTTATSSSQASSLAGNSSTTTAQSQLLNGTLNLDPENDPTLFKTDSGLEVKFAGGTLTSEQSTSLAGYGYFTLGSYNGTPIHWVIIGYSNTINLVSQIYAQSISSWRENATTTLLESIYTTSNPAGLAISNEATKQLIMQSIIASATLAQQNETELDNNEFLCFASTHILKSKYGSTGNYLNSTVKSNLDTLFDNTTENGGLGLTDQEKKLIDAQDLKTIYTSTILDSTENLFLLASKANSSSQNFCVETYLTSDDVRRNSESYWLRSGLRNQYGEGAAHVSTNSTEGGGVSTAADTARYTFGVRPAFVLKLA